ncbi:poly(3-hydroxyalkanoate) depolymerase [Rhodococcus aetherivorans]|uniref:poly(3-hydroxyalkanoate) depolymerase n=1 Tax=Rhodococcus aetherivorans TaxID=191292 RepID=UPI0029497E2C|nr:poly(3-hydroxyalkanoate) depolymerase [Rhodococcus aetherivorans]MDV6294112.1 poly(3-hydroxyalkanoate) depolymerase [Rhodococcus aetherivorans]
MTGDARTTQRTLTVGRQRIRVHIRRGSGVPLVLCNGIGAGLEVLDPFVAALDPATTIVRFDVPGVGGSRTSFAPYGFGYLARLLGRVLDRLGIGVVDVLGLSWGGALAQQFAFQNPRRCRRLVLVATATGALMVPGHPRVLAKMLTGRRFTDPDHTAAIAGQIYGGTARSQGSDIAALFDTQSHAGSTIGYLHQLLAGAVWTSLPMLPLIRQPTLIVAGTDDPIVPIVNAHILHRLLPHATLYLHNGGHIEPITNAGRLAPVIDAFLHEPEQRR